MAKRCYQGYSRPPWAAMGSKDREVRSPCVACGLKMILYAPASVISATNVSEVCYIVPVRPASFFASIRCGMGPWLIHLLRSARHEVFVAV